MKVNTPQICAFCGSKANGSNPNERLHIHRWIKSPQRASKREKTTIDFPTCEKCHKRFHPYAKNFLTFATCASVIAVICVLFSFIQRELFSLSVMGGIISFVLCAGGAAAFTYFGYLMTYSFYDDAFSPSIKIKPYCDMPVVKYVVENGFVDENDEKYETIDVNCNGFTTFTTIRETLKSKFRLS